MHPYYTEELSNVFLPYRSIIQTEGFGYNPFLFLPGISVSCKRTFNTLSAAILGNCNNRASYLDYAQNFSAVQLGEDVDLFARDNPNSVILGLSFGAKMLTEIFLKNPQIQQNVRHLVLLGPFFYLDRASKLNTLLNMVNNLPYEAIPFMGDLLAKLAILNFRYDPMYLNNQVTRADLIAEQNFVGFKNRLAYFASGVAPNPYLFGKITTPTTILWWQNDVAGEHQREQIINCFANCSQVTVPGHHATTESSANDIVTELLFLINEEGSALL